MFPNRFSRSSFPARFVQIARISCISGFGILCALVISNYIVGKNPKLQSLSQKISPKNALFNCYQPDPFVIYRPIPNDTKCESKDNNGFRTSPLSTANFDKTIVVLGDSFVYGPFLENSQTYPAYLEAILNNSGYNVRVLNGGVVGYGTDQEYIYFQHYILPVVKPDIVVWNIHENDPTDNDQACLIMFKKGTPNFYSGRLNTLYALTTLDDRLPKFITNTPLYNLILGAVPPRFTLGCSTAAQAKTNREKFQHILSTIDLMKKLSIKYHFKLVLTFVQSQLGYKYDEKNVEYNNYINEYLQTFSSYDIHPIIISTEIHKVIAASDITNVLGISTDNLNMELFNTFDPEPYGFKHMSSTGNYMFARAVAANLRTALDK